MSHSVQCRTNINHITSTSFSLISSVWILTWQLIEQLPAVKNCYHKDAVGTFHRLCEGVHIALAFPRHPPDWHMSLPNTDRLFEQTPAPLEPPMNSFPALSMANKSHPSQTSRQIDTPLCPSEFSPPTVKCSAIDNFVGVGTKRGRCITNKIPIACWWDEMDPQDRRRWTPLQSPRTRPRLSLPATCFKETTCWTYRLEPTRFFPCDNYPLRYHRRCRCPYHRRPGWPPHPTPCNGINDVISRRMHDSVDCLVLLAVEEARWIGLDRRRCWRRVPCFCWGVC
jgi:hypothetical protein